MYQVLCALSCRNKTYVLAILLTLKQVLLFHNILWENLYKLSGQPNTWSHSFCFHIGLAQYLAHSLVLSNAQ